MKFVIVLAALVTLAVARPQKDVEIAKYSNDNIGVGDFNWGFELTDGQGQEQSGKLVNPGAEDEHYSVSGSFKFVADDGVTYTVNYIADENGFQPQGAHLPQPPQPTQ